MTDSLLLPPRAAANGLHRPARLVKQAAAAAVVCPRLAEPGSEQRWRQLQGLRRGHSPHEPWIEALIGGLIPVDADLLAALWARPRWPS